MSPEVQTYGQVTILFILLAIVMNGFIGVGLSVSTEYNQPAAIETLGGSGSIDTGGAELLAINSSTTSLEDAVQLSGGDSEVSGSIDTDVRGDWTFCTWAGAEPSVENNSESRAIAGYNDIVISYNGTSGEYETWYYDAATQDSYVSTVAAPSPTNQTHVCAVKDGDQLTTYQNTTAGTTVTTTGDNIASSPSSANWNGTLDETRLYNYSLNASQRSEAYSEPVLAVDGDAPAARITYDVRDRGDTSVPVHFADGSASLSNAGFVDGFDAVDAEVGTDFTMSGWFNATASPTSTNVVDDDGTVLYINWTGEGGLIMTALSNMLAGAIRLLVVGLIVLAAGFLLTQLNEF